MERGSGTLFAFLAGSGSDMQALLRPVVKEGGGISLLPSARSDKNQKPATTVFAPSMCCRFSIVYRQDTANKRKVPQRTKTVIFSIITRVKRLRGHVPGSNREQLCRSTNHQPSTGTWEGLSVSLTTSTGYGGTEAVSRHVTLAGPLDNRSIARAHQRTL